MRAGPIEKLGFAYRNCCCYKAQSHDDRQKVVGIMRAVGQIIPAVEHDILYVNFVGACVRACVRAQDPCDGERHCATRLKPIKKVN